MSELSADQRQAIISALGDNNKILAIKLYRDATGSGLRDAKDFIEQLQVALKTGESSDDSPSLSAEADQQILELLQKGDMIAAIKVYRSKIQCSLREAKQAVETIASENGIQASRSGCGATVLALCSAFAVIGFLFS